MLPGVVQHLGFVEVDLLFLYHLLHLDQLALAAGTQGARRQLRLEGCTTSTRVGWEARKWGFVSRKLTGPGSPQKGTERGTESEAKKGKRKNGWLVGWLVDWLVG